MLSGAIISYGHVALVGQYRQQEFLAIAITNPCYRTMRVSSLELSVLYFPSELLTEFLRYKIKWSNAHSHQLN